MTYAERRGALRPFALAAMRLAFREGADLGRPDAVLEAARRCELDAEAVAQALSEQSVKDGLREVTDEALALGVFGVPTVVVGGELFWGDDRLAQAAAASALQPGRAELPG
jgi:2-hydroxychromene-2-carboxylate isomerase